MAASEEYIDRFNGKSNKARVQKEWEDRLKKQGMWAKGFRIRIQPKDGGDLYWVYLVHP